MSKETQQECLVKLFKTSGKCQREISLNSTGQPTYCQNKAFAKMENGISLCYHHMEQTMDAIEQQLCKHNAKIHPHQDIQP